MKCAELFGYEAICGKEPEYGVLIAQGLTAKRFTPEEARNQKNQQERRQKRKKSPGRSLVAHKRFARSLGSLNEVNLTGTRITPGSPYFRWAEINDAKIQIAL